jgi:hypothetical protein
MNRLNLILVVLLVVQLALAAAVLWPRPASSVGEGASLFPDLDVSRIVELTITGGDGQAIRLARQADAPGWILPDAGGYPVDEEKVSGLLSKLGALKADRLVTETSASHKRLRVAQDDFERRIEFALDDGTRHRLYLGSAPSYGVSHVRAEDQDQVYLTSDLPADDAGVDATSWTDRVYFSVPQDQLTALTLENGNGRFELRKEGDLWTMTGLAAGETLDQNKIKTLVSRLTSVAMVQPLGREEQASYSLDKPSAVVTLQAHSEQDGDKAYVLRVGAKDPADNNYTVISSESPFYVQVAEFSVKDLVESGRQDLLTQPPTPTPAPGATPAG